MCDKKEKQLELDKRYLRMATVWAENSYCKRRQVGALIVKDQMIISDGYNGTPSGFENIFRIFRYFEAAAENISATAPKISYVLSGPLSATYDPGKTRLIFFKAFILFHRYVMVKYLLSFESHP